MLCRAGSGHRFFLSLPSHSQPTCIFTSSISKLASSSLTKRNCSPPNTKSTERIPKSLLSNFSPETSKFLRAIEKMCSVPLKREEILHRLKATPSKVLENSKTVCAFAQEVVQNRYPERAVHVLRISHRLGIALAHNQYEQVVYQLATHKYWNHACDIAAMAEKLTGRWTTRLLNWLILSHVETQQYALLPEVLQLFKRDGLTPTQKTFHLLVRGHLQNSDLISARNCLVSMRNAGIEMNKSTYLTVLGAYRTLGPNDVVEEQAFQTLRGIGDDPADTFILNGLLQLRIDDGDADGAFRVLKFFALSPLSDPEEATYNAFGASGASSRRAPKTPPDNTTFNILLAFFARQKDGLPNVLHIFGQLSAAGLRADVIAVAALVRAHFNAGMAHVAVTIVAEMCRTHNLAVNLNKFRLFGYSGEPLSANVLHALSVCPTAHIFNAMLQGVLPEHALKGIRGVLRIMIQAGVSIDASTTQIIVSYLCDAQHIRPRGLIRVLRSLITIPTDQASLTIHHANTILRCLLRYEWDIIRTESWNATAQRVRFRHHSRFSAERLSKPARTFDPTAGIALSSYKRSVRKLFQPLITTLLDKKVMSNSVTFALSIRRNALIKMDLNSARRVFDVMVARGIRPNAYHFSALMEGHVAQGDMDGAKEVMSRAISSGVAPNVVMHTILIIGFGKLGRPDLAMRAFNDMKIAGVNPDFAAIDAVVSAYWFVRQYRTARKVLLDLWCLVAPFPQHLLDAPLHLLIQSFRALKGGSKVNHQPKESVSERRRRRRVIRQMARTIAQVKVVRAHLVQDSVSWAKEYVDLKPMFRVENVRGGIEY